MMTYNEYSNFERNDLNEKSKERKKIAKFKPKKINSKFNEFDRKKEEIEKEESRKNLIKKTMNQYVNGSSAFD